MCPSVSMMSVVGGLCVLLAAVSVGGENKLYKKVGDEVVLQPGITSAPTSSIVWKQGSDIAMDWYQATGAEGFRQFKVRGRLNNKTGEMTITGLTRADSGLYKAEINDGSGPVTHLFVISPVPTPTAVLKTCDNPVTKCFLSCDGNTTDTEPFTYKWKADDTVLPDSSKEIHIMENGSSIKEFSCELENPVSRESSQPIPSPFMPEPDIPSPVEGLKISTGLTVFISLLTAVVLLVLIHKLKSGKWFFQKESMPWEADFWRKDERQPRDAAESNGAARQEKEQTDEETPMT
ncbi:uncharacterized protein ABDE67_022115 [Symphorus nematophorus]